MVAGTVGLAACAESDRPEQAGGQRDDAGLSDRTAGLDRGPKGPDAEPAGSDMGANTDAFADQGAPDGEAPDQGDGPGPEDVCDRMNLPRDPFREGSGGLQFGDVAGDFTVNELNGLSFTLSQRFTGCESYVFFVFQPGVSEQVWNSSVRGLLSADPDNVQYFYISDEASEADRLQRIQSIERRIEETVFRVYSDDIFEADRQFQRFHFVTDRARDVEGSVGRLISDYGAFQEDRSNWVDLGDRGVARPPPLVAFGIDREQRWDSGGSASEFVGGPSSQRMFGYLGLFYNHKARVRHQVATETGVDKHILLEEPVTDRIFVRRVVLPEADEMKDYDRFEFDVRVECKERNVFACSEWDRIGRIQLCLDGESCESRTEIARWITPYWRRGSRRWIMDATPLLGAIREGGETWFRIVMGPPWERKTQRDVRFELRLSRHAGGDPTPVSAELAFRGGPWNAEYNDRKEPYEFTPPEGASKVELVVLVSGHGQADGTNCAEWCDHRHSFTVNGGEPVEIRSTFGTGIGSTRGCAPLAAEGVSPGQWGNWAPQRAYWCPGLPVRPRVVDITEQVTLGQTNVITYDSAYFDPRGNRSGPAGGNIDLSVYVTHSE